MNVSSYAIVDGFGDPDGLEFLHEHYGDPPLRGMPLFMLRRLLRIWSRRDDVFFLLAKDRSTCVGFLLAQAVGARPWRVLLRDPIILPYALAALARRRLFRGGGTRLAAPEDSQVLQLDPQIEIPQQLKSGWGKFQAANVEFIFVHQSERGHGLAQILLDRLVDDLNSHQIPVGLAYIAPSNFSSVAAFRKAGWKVISDAGVLRAFKTSAR